MRKVVRMPGEAVVGRVHDARMQGRKPVHEKVSLLMLDGNHKGTVLHGNTASGALEGHFPVGTLYLAGNVHRGRPGESVIGRLHHHELRRLRHIVAGTGPCKAAPVSDVIMPVRPHCKAEDVAGVLVHEEAGVADTVLVLRQAAILSHVHDELEVAPGLAAVGRTLHAHVDVSLKVIRVGITHIISGDKRSGVGSDEGRNTEGGHCLGTSANVFGVSAVVKDDA